MIYGYARISSPRQNIERQIRNIKGAYPEAVVIQEVFTGTNYKDRKRLKGIVRRVKDDDTIVFDSVSRMSRNAKEGFELYEELFNGTNYKDRKRLKGIVRRVKDDDTIVFDSVSRMSRNAKEGFELYEELFNRGIHLVFLKEPHINTDVYRRNMNPDIQMTGEKADILLEAVKRYLLEVRKQIFFWRL